MLSLVLSPPSSSTWQGMHNCRRWIHKGREFDKKLDKFVKRVTATTPRIASSSFVPERLMAGVLGGLSFLTFVKSSDAAAVR